MANNKKVGASGAGLVSSNSGSRWAPTLARMRAMRAPTPQGMTREQFLRSAGIVAGGIAAAGLGLSGVARAQTPPYDNINNIIKDISGDMMYSIVDVLTNTYHGRGAGEQENFDAANYISDFFGGYGLEPYIQDFSITHLKPDELNCSFEITDLNGHWLRTAELGTDYIIRYKSDSGININAEVAIYDDKSPQHMSGKFVLNNRPWYPSAQYTTKIDLAGEISPLGAVGYCTSSETLMGPVGASSYRPGLIGLRITNELAQFLFSGVGKKARLTINMLNPDPNHTLKVPRANPIPIDIPNVIGVLPADESSPYKDDIIIVCAHFDGQGRQAGLIFPGANDDAAGTAMMMETARVLGAYKNSGLFKRTIYFVAFNAEEEGLLGSQALVQQLINEGKFNNLKAIFHYDGGGYGPYYIGVVNNCPRILDIMSSRAALLPYNDDYVTICTAERGSPASPHCTPTQVSPINYIIPLSLPAASMGTDSYSFQDIAPSIPIVLPGFMGDSPEYHTIYDTIDLINKNQIELMGKIIAATVLELVTSNRPITGMVPKPGQNTYP